MAYMNTERKRQLSPAINRILKSNGLSGTLSVKNNLTLVLTIRSGWLDFIGNFNETVTQNLQSYDRFTPATGYIQVNEHHLDHAFSGEALRILEELKAAMMDGNWNDSDIQTDYFNVGWYISIRIGRYDRPYLIK